MLIVNKTKNNHFVPVSESTVVVNPNKWSTTITTVNAGADIGVHGTNLVGELYEQDRESWKHNAIQS